MKKKNKKKFWKKLKSIIKTRKLLTKAKVKKFPKSIKRKKSIIKTRKLLTKAKVKKFPKSIKRKKRKSSSLTLIKSLENPIISPKAENGWESWQVFNPGVILLDNKVYFLYRAIGEDGISRLGCAVSDDGFKINERLISPIYEHRLTRYLFNSFSFASGGSWGGCEDSRPVQVNEEDTLYMTYTACDEGLRVALTSIKINDFLKKRWRWKSPTLISPPNQTHKNWVIFPEKINGKYAIIHSLAPKISISYFDSLKFKKGEYIYSYYDGKNKDGGWEAQIRGIGPAPIKTKYGWLLFYHGIDKLDSGKYKVGAMLLDIDNPEKILCRLKEPILEPSEDYENNGFKTGVVYASGAIVKNGELFVYYGGADSYVCVASADLNEFLESLKKEIKPKLKRKILNKKPKL